MADSSYYVAWQMTQNNDLTMRIAAAAGQEAGDTIPDVEQWAREKRWGWATKADWVAAVAAAQETGITAWGSNPAVISDYMILSYVQGAVA